MEFIGYGLGADMGVEALVIFHAFLLSGCAYQSVQAMVPSLRVAFGLDLKK